MESEEDKKVETEDNQQTKENKEIEDTSDVVKKNAKELATPYMDAGRNDVYSMYKDFAKDAALSKESSSPEGEASDTETDENQNSDTETDSSESKESESKKSDLEESDSEGKQDEKSKQPQKTVPLAALQSEREKRKEANLALKKQKEDDEAKYKLLEDRLKSIEVSKEDEQWKKALEDGEELSDKEKLLMKRLDSVESKLKQQKSQSLTNDQKALQEHNKRRMIETDKQLREEGFPGFKRAMLSNEIHQAINKRLTQGLINDRDIANETTWIDAFKEEVYPELEKEFGSKSNSSNQSKKKEAKNKANLAGKSGNPPIEEKKESEPYSRESYLNKYFEDRRKNSLGVV